MSVCTLEIPLWSCHAPCPHLASIFCRALQCDLAWARMPSNRSFVDPWPSGSEEG